jgi:S-adenosylmethionine uptake transporter
MFGTTVLFFSALSLLPLGTVSALSNTNPLFVLFLAGPFLGERPTRPALVGALIGFGGTLAITGLGTTALDPRMLAPLAFALVYALFSMLTRVLREDDSDVTVFWSAVVCLALAIVLVIVIPVDQPPTALQWLGIGLLGLMALTGHWLLVEAYRWGRASDLAPLGYLGILWSFLVGTAVFGEPITVVAAGGAIAIAVGGIVALRSAPEAEGVDVVPPFDRGDPAETA